jgi:hypothetical protein
MVTGLTASHFWPRFHSTADILPTSRRQRLTSREVLIPGHAVKTIRQMFPKIRTYLLRRKRRCEVDARGQGVGRRFYFTDRPSAFGKAREVATVCSRQSVQELPVELQRPDLLRRLLALLEREQKTITTDRRLPELLKEWVAARQADKLKPLRPRSFKTILFVSRRFENIFGNAPLDDLTREKIEAVYSGQNWSPQSLKNYRSYLSQFFNWCIRRGYATSNPVQHLQIATVHSTVEIYSLEQVKTIFAKLQEPEFVGLIPYFCLGLFAGVRPLEARRMTWENNIHLETGELGERWGSGMTIDIFWSGVRASGAWRGSYELSMKEPFTT